MVGTSQRRVGVAAVMRQEGPYVLDWVAWHRLLGFETLIADNGGTDSQSEILQRLHACGHIVRLDFRAITRKPQVPAYNALIRTALRLGIDYLGFLDADEFFEPLSETSWQGAGARTVADAFAASKSVTVAFNWMCFGDSMLPAPAIAPVTERFTWAARQNSELNLAFKSFCDVTGACQILDSLPGSRLHPHGVELHPRNCWHDGGPLRIGRGFGGSAEVSWKTARIRHYVIKTFPEFQSGKVLRGGGDKSRFEARYDRAFFDAHNRNELNAPLPAEIMELLKASMMRLSAEIEVTKVPTKGLAGINLQPWRLAWLARDFWARGWRHQFDKTPRLLAHATYEAAKLKLKMWFCFWNITVKSLSLKSI